MGWRLMRRWEHRCIAPGRWGKQAMMHLSGCFAVGRIWWMKYVMVLDVLAALMISLRRRQRKQT
eukprot:242114-Prorocentrum_lima.AAC.1